MALIGLARKGVLQLVATTSPPDIELVVATAAPNVEPFVAASPPDVRYRLKDQEPILNLTPYTPAPPPDVRRGSAPPFISGFRLGYALGSGFAPSFYRLKAEPGAQPQIISEAERRGIASPHIGRRSRSKTRPCSGRNKTRRCSLGLRAALMIKVILLLNLVCFAQTENTPVSSSPASTKPLTADEREELLKLIRSLQERLDKLEAAQASASQVAPAQISNSQASPSETKYDPSTSDDPHVWMEPVVKEKPVSEAPHTASYGRYNPNLGYKLANTEYGDLSVSIYTYARYLNQLGLASNYTDAFGNIKSVQERQDFQLQKVQIKFLGWVMNPKLRYFLYTWTSNATQGQGAQVVVAGNVGYTFNDHFTLAAGITSLPGVRTTEGNFPFWLSVDSRHIADEFFRPSYTSGVWLKGNITKRLRYQVMLGNNMSTLGVSAARLDNKFNTLSSALVWAPTGEYGQGFSDFEDHQSPTTRFGIHFTRSDENKESQPNSDNFENTQLRLSDGTVIFTPDLFGPGITITDATYRMLDFDGGIKYRGFALEGEYYWRWLNNFKGDNTADVKPLFDHGFQLQASAMIVPKTVQFYVGSSRINGQFGNPWDIRSGINWFPWKNKVVRWNNEWLYLYKSPVGYSSVPFALGGKGSVFHSTLELAF